MRRGERVRRALTRVLFALAGLIALLVVAEALNQWL
jgi:hypothetical protein